MSESTRVAALEKLDAFRVKIGYPDEWRDWSGLQISRDSYAGNRLAAARFEADRQLARISRAGGPCRMGDAARTRSTPTSTRSATRSSSRRASCSRRCSTPTPTTRVNYGGIGMVIAHEITHAFDDQGRRFDATGAFRDWWTDEDQARFSELADRLVAQFDAYEVAGGLHVNGRLTLGENIADLGGLALTSRAHARVSAGAPTHRRHDSRPAALPRLRDPVALAHERRADAHADPDRSAQPGPPARDRAAVELVRLRRRPTGSPTTRRSCAPPRIASRSGSSPGPTTQALTTQKAPRIAGGLLA